MGQRRPHNFGGFHPCSKILHTAQIIFHNQPFQWPRHGCCPDACQIVVLASASRKGSSRRFACGNQFFDQIKRNEGRVRRHRHHSIKSMFRAIGQNPMHADKRCSNASQTVSDDFTCKPLEAIFVTIAIDHHLINLKAQPRQQPFQQTNAIQHDEGFFLSTHAAGLTTCNDRPQDFHKCIFMRADRSGWAV